MFRRRCVSVALLVVVGCLPDVTPHVRAQHPPLQDVADALHADATFSDVYVNDSFEAADAIARARALAQRGDWQEAAKLLQRTSDASGDKLVRISPRYYVGIRDHINKLVASWPRPGLAAYRTLYERELQTALTDLGPHARIDRLLEIFDQYFCTIGAADLGVRIAESAIESGDFAAAEFTYRLIADRHPSLRENRSGSRAMLTLLAAINGTGIESKSASETVVRWMGADRTVKDIKNRIADEFSVAQEVSTPDSWPIFGGASERNRRCTTTVDELGLLWRTGMGRSPPSHPESPNAHGAVPDAGERAVRLTVQPVVHGNLVILQRFRDILALKLNTGAIAWRFRADSSGSDGLRFLDEQPPGWDAVTVFDHRVYASLPGETLPYYSYESARSPSELVCLDVETGRTIWRLDQQIIEEDFAETLFDSSPLVRQGRLFVIGRRRRSFGFEDCYLYCFDTANGKPVFRTHLGSASTGTFGSRKATKSIASMHGDTIYVCTNLGTIAAVSGTTGAVRWLRLYARVGNDKRAASQRTIDGHRPWHYNPVIWSDDRLIVMPADSEKILLLEADDGRALHSVSTEAIGHMESILGVNGNILCGYGAEVACYDLASNTLLWSAALPNDMTPMGRGVWTDDLLLIPTASGITTFLVSNGERAFTRWDVEGDGGNVLALDHQLLVAGTTGVSAYVRLGQILGALRNRMWKASSDPVPALELAEVALSNGEYEDALTVLDEAVRRAEQLGERIERSVRQRVFDDLLMFARRLASHDRLEPETLEKLFGFASRFPPNPASNLAYRFLFANLFEQQGYAHRAVELYEQILRDRLLRKLPADDLSGLAESAGNTARHRIDALIREHGRAVYARYEAEAKDWLHRGRKTKNTADLMRVVEAYPNSDSASSALVALGDLLVLSGEGKRATRFFSKALHEYPKRVNRPRLLRKIADAYEAAGMPQHAFQWLTKAAREHPSVRFDHRGRRVTFREYRDRLDHVRSQVDPSRPTILLPLNHHFVNEFDGTATLLKPRFSDAPRARWSRFFVRTKEGIRAFDSHTGLALWAAACPVQGDVEALLSEAALAVFGTSHEIFAVDMSTGLRAWSYGSPPRGAHDANVDWENDDAFRGFVLQGSRLVAVRESGRMICLAIQSGETLWSRVQQPQPRRLWPMSESWVVFHAFQDDTPTIYILDAASGEFVSAIDTQEKRTIEAVFATIDGQIVVVGSQSISSFEPETGARRWRTPMNGRIHASSLLVDVDTLYLSDNGRTVKSMSLENGRLLWESERMIPRGREDLTVALAGSSVIVSSSLSVGAVDAVTGLTLWQGTTPDNVRFVARFLTDTYVAAVNVPEEGAHESVVYFYDHRNASGLIPRDGGSATLATLNDLRTILATNGGIIAQTGTTIHGWVHR